MIASLRSLLVIGLAAGSALAASSSHPPKITKHSKQNQANYTAPYFPLLGFEQYPNNPIMRPDPNHDWESAYLYNPSAIVMDDRVFLLYRAQNKAKTSSIGLAWSSDGYNFTRYSKPIVYATEPYEKPGGCEDPRVVRIDGTFYLTYTAYDGKVARLCLATSTDLVHWKKHGPMLPGFTATVYNWHNPVTYYSPNPVGWTKSGAIIDERQPDGYYYMHFGDTYLYTANSSDLINWEVSNGGTPFAPLMNLWESALMEPAAPPVKTRDGKWLKMYNGMATGGAGGYTVGQYSTGQMLIDPAHSPYGPPICRLETPILQPTTETEINGQVDNVVFSEGLVQFNGKWLMYFGQGDAFLGVAQAPVQP